MVPLRLLHFALLSISLPLLATQILSAANIGYTSNQPPDSAVILSAPADYLAVEVRIRSDEADWNTRMDAIAAARRTLETGVTAAGFDLDSNRPFSFKETYNSKGSSSSFSFFSYSSEASLQPGSVARILAPMDAKTGTISVIRKIKNMLDGLKTSKKTFITMGDIRLALKDPETRRPQLLEAIAKHLTQTQAALGVSERSVGKLDAPIILTQLDEHTIGLFLPFEAIYGTRGISH